MERYFPKNKYALNQDFNDKNNSNIYIKITSSTMILKTAICHSSSAELKNTSFLL